MAALGGMDEDFFLYYEEVAFSRAAQRLGWRVEYDASVTVVHRHPLQNRPISPKMRVITRHSKLLYFLKHLPRWQFLGLCGIVRIEAAIRRVWSRARRHQEELRAWQAIGEIATKLMPEAWCEAARSGPWRKASPKCPPDPHHPECWPRQQSADLFGEVGRHITGRAH